MVSSSRLSLARFAPLALLALLVFAPGARAASAHPLTVPAFGNLEVAKLPVRAEPSRSARVVARLSQFEADYRLRVILALEVKTNARGAASWYRISLPGRPNGRTGWVPAAAVSLKPIYKEIVIRRGQRVLELVDHGRVVFRTRVAVGRPGMETPLGRFYVQAKFRPTAPVLGAFGFETSAYSKLSEWPGGGIVGIHGTNTPSLLGQAVSHGCVRVANEAILRLRDLVPVGTPITIRA